MSFKPPKLASYINYLSQTINQSINQHHKNIKIPSPGGCFVYTNKTEKCSKFKCSRILLCDLATYRCDGAGNEEELGCRVPYLSLFAKSIYILHWHMQLRRLSRSKDPTVAIYNYNYILIL